MKSYFYVSGIFLLIGCLSSIASAECAIVTSDNKPASMLSDSIYMILSSSTKCPKDVFAFRRELKNAGLKLETTMVANRGYHNPDEGSFSFFEIVSGSFHHQRISRGDFFFGHFTTVNDKNELTADQNPTPNALMIEAFAFDPQNEIYNFYELRGNGKEGQWFYRGNSADIYADNTLLHRQDNPANPQFGSRLRCSGCHIAGGPIMKEISAPFNDWWEPKRKLDFGGRQFNTNIIDIMESLVPPDQLAESVKLGILKLEDTQASHKQSMSLQEKLRPLFCPMEINFESDKSPNENQQTQISIPVGFFINPLLVNTAEEIFISRIAYQQALTLHHSRFPETLLDDADHAWLTPIKAASDLAAISHLIKIKLIDAKFAADVLSIDMTNPVFSKKRCDLLTYVPNNWSPAWQEQFAANLSGATNNQAAQQLLAELKNETHTPAYHRETAIHYLKACETKLKNQNNVEKIFKLLAQRRMEIKESEISKNPRGQILEPGFRVIFPETDLDPNARFELTSECDVLSRTGS